MNIFIENVRLAMTSLLANKSRALLTMLGIIIGIGSVIAIMTVGNSLTMSVSSSMQSMGANNITVSVAAREETTDEQKNGIVFGNQKKNREMTEDDYVTDSILYEMCEHFSDEVEAISISENVGNTSVKKGTSEYELTFTGVSHGYFKANELTMLAGSKFSETESQGAKNVVLIADTFADEYFGLSPQKALGEKLNVRINNQDVEYTIVGVYEYEESTFSSSSGTTCYIPLMTAQNFNHSKNYASFSVVSKVGVDSDDLAGRIENYLNGYYRSNGYYEISAFSMSSMVSTLSDMMGTITTAIAVIAGIALLVGGIGVMNIMLVSITERTREIGTRKALGASNGHIRTQFIVEAMIICLVGGIIGVLFGLGLGYVGALALGYAASPSVLSIVGSLAFSLAIGLFFGYYPANKAAKMNPIDALRYE